MFEFKKPGLSFLKKKKKKDVFGKGGAASGNKILRRDLKNSYRDPHISKTVGKLRNLSYFLVFKWYKRFSDDRENVMDGGAGGKTIISKLRILQNEVRGVINSDRRLTVREFAEKLEVSKTTVYDILSQDLNMSRVCRQCSKTFH